MHAGETIFTRTLNIAKSSSDLSIRIAPAKVAVARLGGGELSVDDEGFHVLELAAAATPSSVKILSAAIDDQDVLDAYAETSGAPIDLGSLMAGGQRRWPGLIQTEGKMGSEDGAFAVDEIELPWDERNPWNSWMRLGGFDFFADGKRAAVCTWLGDVWIVDGHRRRASRSTTGSGSRPACSSRSASRSSTARSTSPAATRSPICTT